ncbi:MAG: aminopeptidase P family protein [Deltaproteobacteria bacterium]|nr:aminopeptidase P family protein [Deltaproteobacteria bacterium]
MQDIKKRLSKMKKALFTKNIEAFIVASAENRRYLSGFTAADNQPDELAGIIIITQDKAILITDFRYEIQAEAEIDSAYQLYIYKKNLLAETADIIKKLNPSAVGFESYRLTYFMYKKLIEHFKEKEVKAAFVPGDNIVEDIRIIKEEVEIKLIKNSLDIAESAFADFMKKFKLGVSEKEAAWLLEQEMRKKGADELSFSIIAASGPNAAIPHAICSDRVFKKGETILFDWGVKKDGYCSDISRTFIFGMTDNLLKEAFNAVLEAQNKAIALIKPGANSVDIDNAARKHIDDMGFKEKFGHALGHGVGLNVHEAPRINRIDNTILKKGMVFTVEPGIYIKNYGGIRLENMVAVTKEGAQVLNSSEPSLYLDI